MLDLNLSNARDRPLYFCLRCLKLTPSRKNSMIECFLKNTAFQVIRCENDTDFIFIIYYGINVVEYKQDR